MFLHHIRGKSLQHGYVEVINFDVFVLVTQVSAFCRVKMAASIQIFGHSFVKRLKCFLREQVQLRFNLNLSSSPLVQYSGYSGAVVGTLRSNLTDIVDFSPDIVVLLIGTNDLFNSENPNASTWSRHLLASQRVLVTRGYKTVLFLGWSTFIWCGPEEVIFKHPCCSGSYIEQMASIRIKICICFIFLTVHCLAMTFKLRTIYSLLYYLYLMYTVKVTTTIF